MTDKRQDTQKAAEISTRRDQEAHRHTAGADGIRRKRYDIYLRERREKKHRRDSQKRASMCIYILLNIVACRLFIALSFIYIKGVYCIYIIYIIYPRLMYTFLLMLMY